MGLIRLTAVAAMLAFCLSLWGCQSAPAADPVAEPEAGSVAAGPNLASYKLGNGDRLRITVFDEEELSGEFVVDGTGVVSMPLVGEISAEGITVREFQRQLEAKLSDGFLNNPRVAAEVVNYRPFYIMGEVADPGEYPYSAGLTILNAVATAGGFTYRANKKQVFVRSAAGGEERRVDLTPATKLAPGDTIRIKERIF